jgi:lysophospholipid acyltransferase (LPLAT)-like uncharacterized protein
MRLADRLLLGLVPPLGAAWLRLVRSTMRLRWEGADEALPDDGGPVIYAFWHSQLAMMPWVQLRPPSVIPISQSQDGEWTARLFCRLQVEAVRGSSTRGGVTALRGMVKAARAGKDLAITPDGPRGPARVVQPGAIWIARLTGRPLLPVAFACRPAMRVGSWDRILVPVPLSRGVFVYGDPLWIPRTADEAACAQACDELAGCLDDLTERAQQRLLIR